QRPGGGHGHPGGAAPVARRPRPPVPGGAVRRARPRPSRTTAHAPAGPGPVRGDRRRRMTAGQRLPVLVGVDGSEACRAAIEVGVGEARRWGRPVRLLHVAGDGDLDTADVSISDADALLADALAYATAAAPEIAVTAEVVPGKVVP